MAKAITKTEAADLLTRAREEKAIELFFFSVAHTELDRELAVSRIKACELREKKAALLFAQHIGS